ncbi:MAG: cytochrome c oxidase subunit 3 [Candidatus Marinimicrobia bacterium]|nr:cytochrome c oxidase subunit 3 [Candidatus Neomarinimicrobiota bacterium]MDP7060311.1 cytochrome c oxidase subunit 3 [Candidatus Neomarinimicrobiota bacterium]
MQIPYTVTVRPDTGLYNAKLGIWLFLASEVMLFGGLFSAYILLRSGATSWFVGSEELSVPIGTFNTFVLILSSVTVVMSWASLRMNDLKKYKMYMGLTILLGLVFLVVKVLFEYMPKIEHHHIPSSHNFFAIYFVLTGLHALHVVGGLIVNGYLWGPGSKMWDTDPEQFLNRIEVAGLYWHFVDIIWIFLFPALYLL